MKTIKFSSTNFQGGTHVSPADVVDGCPIDFHESGILKNLIWQVCSKAILDEVEAKADSTIFSPQCDVRIDVKDVSSLPKFGLFDDSSTVILPVFYKACGAFWADKREKTSPKPGTG